MRMFFLLYRFSILTAALKLFVAQCQSSMTKIAIGDKMNGMVWDDH